MWADNKEVGGRTLSVVIPVVWILCVVIVIWHYWIRDMEIDGKIHLPDLLSVICISILLAPLIVVTLAMISISELKWFNNIKNKIWRKK